MRSSRSARDSFDKPKPILPSTVSHGKTPRSWKTKMRRGSGPSTASPSIVIAPLVGERKPRHQIQQRRLAAARRSEQADEFSIGDFKVDVFEHRSLFPSRSKTMPT